MFISNIVNLYVLYIGDEEKSVNQEHQGPPLGIIIGSIVGLLILTAVILGLVVWAVRRNRLTRTLSNML